MVRREGARTRRRQAGRVLDFQEVAKGGKGLEVDTHGTGPGTPACLLVQARLSYTTITLLDDTYREAEGVEAEGRRKAEAPLTSKQAAAATAGIEGAIFEDCVCVCI